MSDEKEKQRRPGGWSPHRITPEVADQFVALVAEGRSFTSAAKELGFHRSAFTTDLAQRDPDFAVRLREAVVDGTGMLVEEARRRAADGWDEPVFRNGVEVGVVRKYDSTLLMFLIKQRDPSFRENARLEIGGSAALEVTVKHDYETILERLAAAGVIQLGSAGDGDAAAAGGAERPALLPARPD